MQGMGVARPEVLRGTSAHHALSGFGSAFRRLETRNPYPSLARDSQRVEEKGRAGASLFRFNQQRIMALSAMATGGSGHERDWIETLGLEPGQEPAGALREEPASRHSAWSICFVWPMNQKVDWMRLAQGVEWNLEGLGFQKRGCRSLASVRQALKMELALVP